MSSYAKQSRFKIPTRLLGAVLAIGSIFAYNIWFRSTLDPAPGKAPRDFRILAIYDDQIITMEDKAGVLSTRRIEPGSAADIPEPWPVPRHDANRLRTQWRTLVSEHPESAVTARCLEFDGRSALIYWNTDGELCALDGETGQEFIADTGLAETDTVLGPKYLSSRDLAVLSVPQGGTIVRLDLLRLQWDTARANLQFAARHYEFDATANAEEIYAFGMVRYEKGFGGFIAGPPPLNMLFSTKEAGLVASGPLPVSVLSLSPDGTRAQIQTTDAGDGVAQVDWINLRLHTPMPMKMIGHETYQWSPDSQLMVIGARSDQGAYVRLYDVHRRVVVFSEPLRTDKNELPLGLWYQPATPGEAPSEPIQP